MNYTTNVAVPTAYITKRKSRLKIYNGHNVFLNDGDNFEFELHNPKTKSVLVKIKLNGSYISTSGIVIRPGQRVFLERFLDTNNKFEFSTYNVKDTQENRSAIALNGVVEIEFYDEQQVINYPHLTGGSWTIGRGLINTGGGYVNTTFTTTNTPLMYSNTSSFSSSVLRSSSKKGLETGRVEKGEQSSQSFTNSYENFSSYQSKSYQFKILPLSQKNKEISEVRQYCTECGVKVKKNFKFCPSCGNKL